MESAYKDKILKELVVIQKLSNIGRSQNLVLNKTNEVYKEIIDKLLNEGINRGMLINSNYGVYLRHIVPNVSLTYTGIKKSIDKAIIFSSKDIQPMTEEELLFFLIKLRKIVLNITTLMILDSVTCNKIRLLEDNILMFGKGMYYSKYEMIDKKVTGPEHLSVSSINKIDRDSFEYKGIRDGLMNNIVLDKATFDHTIDINTRIDALSNYDIIDSIDIENSIYSEFANKIIYKLKRRYMDSNEYLEDSEKYRNQKLVLQSKLDKVEKILRGENAGSRLNDFEYIRVFEGHNLVGYIVKYKLAIELLSLDDMECFNKAGFNSSNDLPRITIKSEGFHGFKVVTGNGIIKEGTMLRYDYNKAKEFTRNSSRILEQDIEINNMDKSDLSSSYTKIKNELRRVCDRLGVIEFDRISKDIMIEGIKNKDPLINAIIIQNYILTDLYKNPESYIDYIENPAKLTCAINSLYK